jgi:hypothetical protein
VRSELLLEFAVVTAPAAAVPTAITTAADELRNMLPLCASVPAHRIAPQMTIGSEHSTIDESHTITHLLCLGPLSQCSHCVH